jgi:LexA-binding, inner membrane-associated putative hydrolase
MTTFGHIGGGLIVATAAQKIIFKDEFSAVTLLVVIFLSILPDLDSIPAFLFRKWRPGSKKLDHHDYVTHTPIFYILLSIIIWIGIGEELGILFLLLTLAHLLLDSYGTDDGIMWLWPMSKRKFSVFPSNLHEGGVYGIRYYLRYVRHLGSFLPEVLLFMGGVACLITWWR